MCVADAPHTSPSSPDDHTCQFLGGVQSRWMLISPSLLPSLLTLNEARSDRQATHLRFLDKCSISSDSSIIRPLEPCSKHSYNV
jgi:hypothetical protein